MRPEDYEIENPVVREFFSRAKALGRAKGLDLGRAEGRAEGYTEGWREGLAYGLLAILKGRSIEVDEKLSSKVLACRDHDHLCLWIDKAVTAKTVADVFD